MLGSRVQFIPLSYNPFVARPPGLRSRSSAAQANAHQEKHTAADLVLQRITIGKRFQAPEECRPLGATTELCVAFPSSCALQEYATPLYPGRTPATVPFVILPAERRREVQVRNAHFVTKYP